MNNFDLFQSRRTYNERCKWWSKSNSDVNTPDMLVMKRVPSGQFWAKEINPETLEKTILGDNFMFDKSTITIKTPDNILGIKDNDIVLYRKEKWLVVDVQKSQARNQQTEFADDNNVSHFWFISLRK